MSDQSRAARAFARPALRDLTSASCARKDTQPVRMPQIPGPAEQPVVRVFPGLMAKRPLWNVPPNSGRTLPARAPSDCKRKLGAGRRNSRARFAPASSGQRLGRTPAYRYGESARPMGGSGSRAGGRWWGVGVWARRPPRSNDLAPIYPGPRAGAAGSGVGQPRRSTALRLRLVGFPPGEPPVPHRPG